MKVLLDENLSHELRHYIPGHSVFTVAYMKWAGVKNGRLLTKAAGDGFDVLITHDGSMEYQQNPAMLPIAVVSLTARTNKIDDILPLVPELLEVLAAPLPKAFINLPRKASTPAPPAPPPPPSPSTSSTP